MLLDYIAHDIDIDDDYETKCFSSFFDVQQSVEKLEFRCDLIFIGISGNEKSGFKLAEYLRKHNLDVDIFFVADNANYISEGFKYRASNYLAMPLDYTQFVSEMSHYLEDRRKNQKNYFFVSINGKQRRIDLDTVKYFSSDARTVYVYFKGHKETIYFYGKINDIQDCLEKEGFLRCHQSYLVNMNMIEQISGELINVSDEDIPISRKYSEHVKEVWKKFNNYSYNERVDRNKLSKIIENKNSTVIMTTNYYLGIEQFGIIVSISGTKQNKKFRLYNKEKCYIGRDAKQCQIVSDEITVSRKHCCIYFDDMMQCYYVCDYSSNGTFINNMTRCPKGKWVKAERDTILRLTRDKCSFLLG